MTHLLLKINARKPLWIQVTGPLDALTRVQAILDLLEQNRPLSEFCNSIIEDQHASPTLPERPSVLWILTLSLSKSSALQSLSLRPPTPTT